MTHGYPWYDVLKHSISFLLSASECKVFLLYYLPSVLTGILPDKFLSHALILCKAIRLLVGDAVSYTDREMSEEMLRLFGRLTTILLFCTTCKLCVHIHVHEWICHVGVQHCTMNVHLLSHLAYGSMGPFGHMQLLLSKMALDIWREELMEHMILGTRYKQ